MSRIALSLALLASVAWADGPSIKVPPTVQAEAGDWVTVTAETDGKVVKWVSMSPSLKVFPTHLLRDTKTAVVSASKPGRYLLLAYTCAGDQPSDPAIATIVIGNDPVPPPIPPPPVPPGPVDALTKKIQDALASDSGSAADKLQYASKLAGFYSAMAKHVDQGNVSTVGDLLSDYQQAMKAVLPDGVIPNTRKVCGQEVFDLSGDDAERKIDAALKQKFVELFGKLSAALGVR